MHKASWTLLMGLLACSDNIGAVKCDGTTCDTTGFMLVPLTVPFENVETNAPRPMPAFTWSIPCGSACSPIDRAQLHGAGDDRTWNVVRGTALPTVELITSDGNRSTQQLDLPTGASQLVRAYSVAQSDGTLLTHALWSQPSTSQQIEEMALFSTVPLQRATLNPVPAARQLGAIRGGDAGYLLFDDDLRNGELVRYTRLIAADGKQRWLAGNLPRQVPFIGGSAVWNTQQYVLAGQTEDRSLYYLMWFDAGGVLQRGTGIVSSNWRSAQLLDQGQGKFIAVAQTDLEAGGVTNGSNTGMIDVVAFDFGDPVRGWRIRRSCLYELEVYGYAVAPGGNVFITTLVGDTSESHGLLCRLPADGVPGCFAAQPGQTFGSLAAIGPNSVVAALNDQIVRIDLP